MFAQSITLDLLLECKLMKLVECGSVPKKRTNFAILPYLAMAIASLFPQFQRKYHNNSVAKIDCVGHVQMQLGTRPRNVMKKEKMLMDHA